MRRPFRRCARSVQGSMRGFAIWSARNFLRVITIWWFAGFISNAIFIPGFASACVQGGLWLFVRCGRVDLLRVLGSCSVIFQSGMCCVRGLVSVLGSWLFSGLAEVRATKGDQEVACGRGLRPTFLLISAVWGL